MICLNQFKAISLNKNNKIYIYIKVSLIIFNTYIYIYINKNAVIWKIYTYVYKQNFYYV